MRYICIAILVLFLAGCGSKYDVESKSDLKGESDLVSKSDLVSEYDLDLDETGTQELITGGVGVTWADTYLKINNNDTELYGKIVTSVAMSGTDLLITFADASTLSGSLATLLDNTDDQTVTNLSLSGTTLSITLEDGNTETVELSSLVGAAALGADDNYVTDAEKSKIGNLPADTTSDLAENTAKRVVSGAVSGENIVLTLNDATTINIVASTLLDNTDAQTITDLSIDGSNILSITVSGGNTETVDLSQLVDSGITDAPSDGTTYGRNNAAWVAITGGGDLLAANNLSEVTPATARTNLDVYSKAEADAVMVYPDTGIPVSLGTSWDSSMSLSELALALPGASLAVALDGEALTPDTIEVTAVAVPTMGLKSSDSSDTNKTVSSISAIVTTGTAGAVVADIKIKGMNGSGALVDVMHYDGSTEVSRFPEALVAKQYTSVSASSKSLDVNEYTGGAVLATAASTYTLPSAEPGYHGCIQKEVGDATVISLLPASGDYIVYEGVAGTVATAFSSTTALGSRICYRSYDTTYWYVSVEQPWAE